MKKQRLYDGAVFTAQRNNKSGSVSPFGLQNTAPGVRENLYLGEVRNHIRRYQLEHDSIPSSVSPFP